MPSSCADILENDTRNTMPFENSDDLLPVILELHDVIVKTVLAETRRTEIDDAARVIRDDEGDTVYTLDGCAIDVVERFLSERVARVTPIVLIAEGLEGGSIALPLGSSENDALWRVIVDPIDGTRGLMYQKRSGWVLTGVAPNRGPATNLSDIVVAVQTEIPTVKQRFFDRIWAIRGRGAHADRIDVESGRGRPIAIRPSRATTVRHGFGTVVRYFPGARDVLAAIDDEIIHDALGPARPGKASCFEDQYISTGGQLYELASGKDRFIADLRPLLDTVLSDRGLPPSLCAHPYDLAAALCATEAGILLTDPWGALLTAPLDTTTPVAWIGYANEAIRKEIEPALLAALARHGIVRAAPKR
jgi:hypothetical protein